MHILGKEYKEVKNGEKLIIMVPISKEESLYSDGSQRYEGFRMSQE